MHLNKLLLCVALAASVSTTATAKVTLILKDGNKITGELIDYTPNGYHINISGHNLIIADKDVICQGSDCPYSSIDDLNVIAAPATQAPSSAKVTISGSNTIGAELMPRIVNSYAQSLSATVNVQPSTSTEEHHLELNGASFTQEIAIKAHGSSTAFKGLADGSTDIGMASRPAKEQEVLFLAANRGINNIRAHGFEHVLALDGLVIIVSPDNPINEIRLSDVRRIFSGEINNWAQLGGNNEVINIYARDDKSGTFDTFKSLVMHNDPVSSAAKRFESNETLSDSVARDAQGIGFTGFAYVRNAKALSLISECGIVNSADQFDVKSEEYPLSRRLFLYADKNTLSAPASSLLNYALSDDAQDVMVRSGFIDQDIEWRDTGGMGQRFAHAATADSSEEYQTVLRDFYKVINRAQRLSSTFRFQRGSFELDVKARQDITRLARYIQNHPNRFNGKTIYIIGYADSVGGFDSNLELSSQRAQAVADTLNNLLRTANKPTITTVALSEVAPVACNSNDMGRSSNRRVEVWVK